MTVYLVSIAPEPDTGAQISIRVEATGRAARLVEMTVRSSSPAGLSLQGLPQLDLAALGRALVAAAGGDGAVVEPEADTPTPHNEAGSPSAGSGESARSRPSTGIRSAKSSPAPAANRERARRTDRAYRRMPDVDELMAAYAEVGSVTKLAERYDVPRHTAQGWMGRARKRSGK